MKQIISILLLFAFVTVNFSKVFIWVNYQVNKTEITEKYCVNKDKPMMHCCGKCMLKKKLAEDEAKQKSPAMPDLKNDIQLFGSPLTIQINTNTAEGIKIASLYDKSLQLGVSSSIFHPPCA